MPALPLYLMGSHNQAMQYWPSLALHTTGLLEQGRVPSSWAEPITVVHLDSHNDMMDIERDMCNRKQGGCWDDVIRKAQATVGNPKQARETRPLLHKKSSERVFISDFITASVLIGTVDNVVWVRSDFAGYGVYNGPPPGRYHMALRNDEGTCFEVLETLETFEGVTNPMSDSISSCQAEPKNKRKKSKYNRIKHQEVKFQLTVITLEQFLRQLRESAQRGDGPSAVLHRGLPDPETRDWIMDLDLDLFATYDPPFALFTESGFADEFTRRAAFLFDTDRHCSNKAAEFEGSGNRISGDCGCLFDGDASETAKLRMLRAIAEMPFVLSDYRKTVPDATVDAKSHLVHLPLKAMDKTCKLGKARAAEAFDLLANLTPEEAARWKGIFHHGMDESMRDDFLLSFFQGTPGVHHGSVDEAERHLGYFDELLGHLLPGPESLPRVITVCRSTFEERYLPLHLWPMIDSRALKALERVLAPVGGYELTYAKRTGLLPDEDSPNLVNKLEPIQPDTEDAPQGFRNSRDEM